MIWPGGGIDVPSDRIGEAHSLGVWLLFVVIIGVLLAFIVGGIMHRHHVYFFPESGATVCGCFVYVRSPLVASV